jgi:Cu2+-containing amine oxidase
VIGTARVAHPLNATICDAGNAARSMKVSDAGIERREDCMQDAVAQARIIAPAHPLDPLTPDEIRRVAAAVRATHDLGAGMMFETISLHEPDKRAVHSATPGAAPAREAFVCAFDRTNGQVWESGRRLAACARCAAAHSD